MSRKQPVLSLHHLEHLSSDPAVLRFARQINASFLRQKLTEMSTLDSELEAVYLWDDATSKIVSILVFYRCDEKEYYIPVVWTSDKYRKQGCFSQLMGWLEEYVASKGARRISADVHHDNLRMVGIMEKHWEKTFLRFNYKVKAA